MIARIISSSSSFSLFPKSQYKAFALWVLSPYLLGKNDTHLQAWRQRSSSVFLKWGPHLPQELKRQELRYFNSRHSFPAFHCSTKMLQRNYKASPRESRGISPQEGWLEPTGSRKAMQMSSGRHTISCSFLTCPCLWAGWDGGSILPSFLPFVTAVIPALPWWHSWGLPCLQGCPETHRKLLTIKGNLICFH